MQKRTRRVFLLLVCAQLAHSVEEFASGFYEVLAPARYLVGLVSTDPAVGFAVLNTAVVGIGFLCYLIPIRSGHRSARGVAWVWAVLELVNGAGHSTLALSRLDYYPGALTAPLLIGAAVWLAVLLRRSRDGADQQPR